MLALIDRSVFRSCYPVKCTMYLLTYRVSNSRHYILWSAITTRNLGFILNKSWYETLMLRSGSFVFSYYFWKSVKISPCWPNLDSYLSAVLLTEQNSYWQSLKFSSKARMIIYRPIFKNNAKKQNCQTSGFRFYINF